MARARVTKQRMRDGSIRFRLRGTIGDTEESLGLFDTEDAAFEERDAWLALNEGKPDGLTLGVFGMRWLDLRETDGAHRNARGDRSRWARYVAGSKLADMLVSRIRREHLVEWLDTVIRMPPVRAKTVGVGSARETKLKPRGGRLSAQTVKHAHRLLAKCLDDAAQRGHIAANPAAGMKVPKIVDPPRQKWAWLTLEEIARVEAASVSRKLRRHGDGSEAGALTPKQRTAFIVAIYTGLREGEVWGLRWCDVRLEGDAPELHVRRSFNGPTKSTEERHVPLLPKAAAALRAWRELMPGVGERLVFPTDGSGKKAQRERTRGGCHGKGYDAGWEQVADQLGIDARFHDLRHTCGSHLVQGSWTPSPLPLIDVRDWMGHSSITVTERYAHLAPGGLHAAIRRGATVTKIAAKRRSR